MCCRAEDVAGGVSPDAESIPDRRGEEPKTREELKEANGGIPILTELCLAMRSDPLGMIRGLGEVVTCIYGPAVTYAFPDLLVVAYQHSVVHVNQISVLDRTALNWCRQKEFREPE